MTTIISSKLILSLLLIASVFIIPGIIPAYAQTAPTVPDAPTGLTATTGDEQVSLTWLAPTDDGGSIIADYLVESSTDGITWTTFNDGTNTTPSAIVTGLTNGQSYDFRVSAINGIGSGFTTNAVTATPTTVPTFDSEDTHDETQLLTIFITNETPKIGEPIKIICRAISPHAAQNMSAELIIDNLDRPNTQPLYEGFVGAELYFTIIDRIEITCQSTMNADTSIIHIEDTLRITPLFDSTYSPVNGELIHIMDDYSTDPNPLLATIPAAPTGLTAVPGDGEVTLSWTVPSDIGGSAITDYLVEFSADGGSNWTTFTHTASDATSIIVTGLTNGQSYDFQVSAINTDGPSIPSATVTATPAVIPTAPVTAPTGLIATPGNTEIILSWTIPTDDGGSEIVDYFVDYKLSSESNWIRFSDGIGRELYAIVDGLTNGLSYDFKVSARNNVSNGPYSDVVIAIPTTVAPDAPTGLIATLGDGIVTLSWSAPARDGGVAISDYFIEYKLSSESTTWTIFSHGSPTTNTIVTPLTNGVQYDFRVSAINAIGTGNPTSIHTAIPATIPGAPNQLTATTGDAEVSLSWNAPVNDGGSIITDYKIEYNDGNGWTTFNDSTDTATTVIVTGLTNNVSYDFRVSAINGIGTGNPSATATVTPVVIPTAPVTAPTGLTAVPGDGIVLLSWTAPSDDGNSIIVDYFIDYRLSGESDWIRFNDYVERLTTATVTGLTNGQSYDFQVLARNVVGTGPYSAPVTATLAVIPTAPVTAPTGLTAIIGNAEVALSWSAPSDNGNSPITDYLVEFSDDNGSNWTIFSHGSPTTNTIVTPLTNGQSYDFRVSAVNVVGTGPYSATVTVTPIATTPDAPIGLTATADDESVTLSWSAPASDGGDTITNYFVEYKLSSASTWSSIMNDSTTSITKIDLTNGQSYDFRVSAVNGIGTGNPSATATATPAARTVPSAPTELTATSGDEQVRLAWIVPSSNGGDIITDYFIEYKLSSESNWSTFPHGTTSVTAIVTGLTNDVSYDFRVSAINGIGTGNPSNVAIISTITAPVDGTGSWVAISDDTDGVTTLQDIYFINENNGWAVGNGIIHTIDGGATWTKFNIDSLVPANTIFTSVDFYDDRIGVAVSYPGIILYTNDGGLSWATATAPVNHYNDVVMTSADNGWTIGPDALAYTIDGGATWSETTEQPVGVFYELDFGDESLGFGVGRSGNMISIDAVSKTFTLLPAIVSYDLQFVTFSPDTMTVWIGTENGEIFYTNDSGSSWKKHYKFPNGGSGPDAVESLVFTNEDNMWVIVSDIIYATTDGGINWIAQFEDGVNMFGLSTVNDTVWAMLTQDGIFQFTTPENYRIIGPSLPPGDDDVPKKSGGGCNDCTPPTLGLDDNSRRVVDNGFSYNGYSIQAEKYHTPYPLINATVGEMNKVEITAYENGGIYNMKLVQFGLGATEIGQPLTQLEVLIEVWLTTNGTLSGVAVDEIVIIDKDNLIDNDSVSAVSYVTQCQSSDVTLNCVKVDLEYSYREATINNVMVVAVSDKKNNNQNFYFNDGIEVLGESLNEPPTYTLQNKNTNQQTDNLYLTLTRADKVNHIWFDQNGIEYLKVSEDRFDRVTPIPPYSCSNDELVIKMVPKRNNICQFMPLLNYEISRAENVINEMYLIRDSSYTVEEFNHNKKLYRQYE